MPHFITSGCVMMLLETPTFPDYEHCLVGISYEAGYFGLPCFLFIIAKV